MTIASAFSGSLSKGFGARSGSTLPRTGLLERWRNGVGTVVLSVDDYLLVRPELRPLFYLDATTKYDDATIITNIEASPYLNNGWELTGNATKGYALYAEGTAETTLVTAYRFYDEIYISPYFFQSGDAYTFQDASTYYFQ